MKVYWLKCSAVYHGRGDTFLPVADRVIIVKQDGSVMIHSDTGIKPLNYMTGTSMKNNGMLKEEHEDGTETWVFDSNKESLKIHVQHNYGSMSPILELEEPGLQRDGTENQLQEYLADNLSALFPHLTFAQREYQTGAGPVDLLAENSSRNHVYIEVKRVATSAAVHQMKRYLEDNEATGFLVALDVRPSARATALKKKISWVQLDWSDRNNARITDQQHYERLG